MSVAAHFSNIRKTTSTYCHSAGHGHRRHYWAESCNHNGLSQRPVCCPCRPGAGTAWLTAAGRLACNPLSNLPAASLQAMARAALSDGNLLLLACPSPDCRLPLPASLVPQVLRGKRQQGRFLELLAHQHIAQHPLMRW